MRWNIAAESISIVMLGIIWSYAKKSTSLPTLKNKLFSSCFFATFCAIVTNIASTIMLAYPAYFSLPFTWMVTSLYFIATPLMGMSYFLYLVSVVYEKKENGGMPVMLWGLTPALFSIIIVLINIPTKCLFDIQPDGNYIQGHMIVNTYIVFYIYCICSFILVFIKRKWLESSVRWILFIFLLMSTTIIFIQQLFPQTLLTGSAETCALLLIYLYLQNKQISIDYLTNLPNRQEFMKMLEYERKKIGKGAFTVIVLSLRDFKQINDTFGQQNGDAFLQAISYYLKTIAQHQHLYRFNGDEFAILVENDTKKRIDELIDRLKTRMSMPWQANGIKCVIQGAIGVVRYPDSADDAEGLVNGIEYAVARAKMNRENAVCYCGQEMIGEIKRHAQIIEILREKLEEDGFEIYYQPIISTKENKFILAESLLRIPQSFLGPIYPSEFIPIAEETGMIVDITYQILDKVCRFSNTLEENDIFLEGINVNFSAVQFTQENLVEKVMKILEENKTVSSKLKIEITESILVENTHTVVEFAESMHEQGILLGLDDFGTGYSNIVSVMDMPMDTIKLDKSLLWSAMENERSAIMMRNLIRIFHELGLNVLAEGVETKEQNDFAIQCEIDLIQGYFYAKPMPGQEVIAFLKNEQKNGRCGKIGEK